MGVACFSVRPGKTGLTVGAVLGIVLSVSL